MFQCTLAISNRRLGVCFAIGEIILLRMNSMFRRCYEQELSGLVVCLVEDIT